MDKQKLTDWFPSEVLPDRQGWYQREYLGDAECTEIPDYFDGMHWFVGYIDGTHGSIPSQRLRRWRGLAEPPLTDWFDPGTPPEREGVYEIEGDDDARRFAHWTPGHGWGFTYCAVRLGDDWAVRLGDGWAVRGAYRDRLCRGATAPRRRWRGLAVQP